MLDQNHIKLKWAKIPKKYLSLSSYTPKKMLRFLLHRIWKIVKVSNLAHCLTKLKWAKIPKKYLTLRSYTPKKMLRFVLQRIWRSVKPIFFYLTLKMKKKYKVVALKYYCDIYSMPIHPVASDKQVSLQPHLFYPPDAILPHHANMPTVATLPDVHIAHLRNAKVIGGYDLVLMEKNIVVYDEVALDIEKKYALRMAVNAVISHQFLPTNQVFLKYKKNKVHKLPDTAIHFCKDYSSNYYHWLIEALPRLWVIDQFPDYANLPLLVDVALAPQQLEALHLLVQNKRELIFLEKNEAYTIKNLIYPTHLSHIHNNYYRPVEYDKDIVLAPKALEYVREQFLSHVPIAEAHRKLYISRRNMGGSKRLLNDEEIDALFIRLGFEIIYPETLSFKEQLIIFSQAKIIVGASGSGLANMMFAPKECVVFLLTSNNKQANFNIFGMVAQLLGMTLCHVVGEDREINDYSHTHNSFVVDTKRIEEALREFTK